ncbi:MAG: hypothetical protein M1833_004932 [Piccolia ochrophora]|nr:MAG: hypothetical protein M1833_004932 [Piccolia ochrophora]
MSEVQPRPAAPRGRTSSRGGRGGYGSRGGARSGRHPTNGAKPDLASSSSFEDEGEIGALKKKYSTQLGQMKQLFPDWTNEDLVFALEDSDGDIERTIDRITEGTISQWGEVKQKSKDRPRSKAKDSAPSTSIDANAASTSRGGRGGRGNAENNRGGRGRGSDRTRGVGKGGRAGSAAPLSGARGSPVPANAADGSLDAPKASIPTDESSIWSTAPSKSTIEPVNDGWDTSQANETSKESWGSPAASAPPGFVAEPPKSGVVSDGPKKSWASMFAKPTAPAVPKSTPRPGPSAKPAAQDTEISKVGPDGLPPVSTDSTTKTERPPVSANLEEPEPNITPSKDALTETNLDKVLDTSGPQISATAASTVASSKGVSGGADTPFSSTAQLPASRPSTGGYAATAFKATGASGRTSSFQRRVLEQQEAVVMPGNHAVDRAAVQFGSLGLNGSGEDLDVDEEREDAETRAQPPQHSPVAQPRAALPPASNQALPSQTQNQSLPQDSIPTPRQAPGLPAAPPQQRQPVPHQQPSPQASAATQSMTQQTSQGGHPYGQFNRYAQASTQQEQANAPTKAYDPFGSQSAQNPPHHLDAFQGQSQQASMQSQHQQQSQQQSHAGAFSAGPADYSSYYTADPQQRATYQQGQASQYGQPAGQSQQDAGLGQQRAGSGFGQVSAESTQYPSAPSQQAPSRYGHGAEGQTSGHSTPNPSIPGQAQAHGSQTQQPQHVPGQQQQQTQGAAHGGYPYSHHSYYSSPYYAYMNQFGGYGQNYGAPYGGKGGPYGQPPQGYGMSPQSSFDHSSSPGNLGGFGQGSMQAREGGQNAALGDYGRVGSAHQNQQHSSGTGAFGGVPDVFGGSGFTNQRQPLSQHQVGSQAGTDDALKGFGEAKTAGGPSPSLNQPGRPGSAANSAPNPQGQSGSAQSQGQQGQQGQGFGGYPSHLNHNVHGSQGGQYGGLGGLGGHQTGAQAHQGGGGGAAGGGGGYGSYGSGYGGSYYGSSGRGGGGGGGGGWGGNYGH